MAGAVPVQLFSFSGAAKSYGACRPVYPRVLFEEIARRASLSGVCTSQDHRTLRVVDIGAGSGQASFGLACRFPGQFRILAVDPSASQRAQWAQTAIRVASQRPNGVFGQPDAETRISYRSEASTDEGNAHELPAWVADVQFQEGDSEAMPCEDHSVDVLMAAQAAHWFDTGAVVPPESRNHNQQDTKTDAQFWREAARVLKPQGILALVGYGNCAVVGNQLADKIVKEYYAAVRPFFPDVRFHVDDHYQAIAAACPSTWFADCVRLDGTECQEFCIMHEAPLSSFTGYLNTWSGLEVFRQRQCSRGGSDNVASTTEKLREALSAGNSKASKDPLMVIRWPLFAVFAHRRHIN